MSDAPLHALRLFVPSEALAEGRLRLGGATATRAYVRGARPGRRLWALDGRGWAHEVRVDRASWDRLNGTVLGRQLAPERRTKVTLLHGLLAPDDTRRLVFAASSAGVIAYGPMITDRSVVPSLLAAPGIGPTAVHSEGGIDLAGLALEAAEISGRGRCPALREPTLFDRALDDAIRAGETIVLAESSAEAGHTEMPAPLLERRPFALALLCPPPDGFSEAERDRALSRGALCVAMRPEGLAEPEEPRAEGEEASAAPRPAPPLWLALAVLDRLYEALEPAAADST